MPCGFNLLDLGSIVLGVRGGGAYGSQSGAEIWQMLFEMPNGNVTGWCNMSS